MNTQSQHSRAKNKAIALNLQVTEEKQSSVKLLSVLSILVLLVVLISTATGMT